jgi:transcriptional regulator with XRE-family HTH domain
MLTPLKAERLRQGLTQYELATRVGITQTELSTYELKKRRAAADMRHRLAKELSCKVEQIFPEEYKETNQ